MAFFIPAGIDPLPAHDRSLRLLRSEVFLGIGSSSRSESEVAVVKNGAHSVSRWIHATIFGHINLEDYLSRGLRILSRLPDVSMQTTQFISKGYARIVGSEALKAFFELGCLYNGEGVSEVLSVVSGNPREVDTCLEDALESHIGRKVAVKLAEICRRVAAEYDAMASVLSLDEASGYLLTRFTDEGRIVSLVKLLLRTGNLLREDDRNIWVVRRGLDASVRSFSFLWSDAVVEARQLIERAKEMIEAERCQEVDFWGVVDKMSSLITWSRISLDAVVAVALAELGVVVTCEREVMSVLNAIAGEKKATTKRAVELTNPGSIWVAPFRALTPERIVMALDGRTKLKMVDDVSGVRGAIGLFEKSDSSVNDFICCEPVPYAQIDEIKSTMPKAFAALAKDGAAWNDGLEKELHHLSSLKVPPFGLEVASVVKAAKENYMQNNVLADKYVRVIFSSKRIMSVYTLAVEQGRRMGDVLYQYSLFMVHPDVSKIGSKRLRELWDNLESLPIGLRRFLDNVKLTYEGMLVFAETGSAGVPYLRRRYTNYCSVWLGYAGPGTPATGEGETDCG